MPILPNANLLVRIQIVLLVLTTLEGHDRLQDTFQHKLQIGLYLGIVQTQDM